MTTQKQNPVEQHNREIQENVISWIKKPALRAASAGFYEAIRSCIDPQLQGAVVELGSGMSQDKRDREEQDGEEKLARWEKENPNSPIPQFPNSPIPQFPNSPIPQFPNWPYGFKPKD